MSGQGKGLFLGAEDTADTKQQKTKGQQNDVNKKARGLVGQCLTVRFICLLYNVPRRSQATMGITGNFSTAVVNTFDIHEILSNVTATSIVYCTSALF